MTKEWIKTYVLLKGIIIPAGGEEHVCLTIRLSTLEK
jgi:hypothetical protein